jgi:predicted amidohydrolase
MKDERTIHRYRSKRKKGKESLIKVASIQMDSRFGDKGYNIQKQTELIREAARKGVCLAVLPELASTGYYFDNRDEVGELAEEVPDGPTCEAWMECCKTSGVHLCGGIAESDGGRYFNTAALIGPDGFIGKYRKTHLWDEEKLFFESGDLGLPVFDLPFGRVGIMICYDAWFPEVPRILALRGADILCSPGAWQIVPGEDTPERPLSAHLHSATAHLNRVFVICANRIGTERGITFLGSSCIAGLVDYAAGPASWDKEEIVAAEINVVQARYKRETDLADRFADRRIDLYDMFLGYTPFRNQKT